MSYNHHKKKFPAVLKTIEDKLVEYGTAIVSIEDQTLDFTGEFVPIFKMGTPLKVVHTQKDVEVQSFTGEVYLSSQHLLRLVSLTDEVLPGASSLGPYDVSMKGRATGTIRPIEPEKHFSLLHKPQPLPSIQTFPITIHALSLSQLKFTCEGKFPEGQLLKLDVSGPIELKSLLVEVEVPIFGPGATCSYRCNIRELTGNNYLQLETYVQDLSFHANKLFPPAPTSSDEVDP